MATNFLILAREKIYSAEDLTSGNNEKLLKLNKFQCRFLVRKLLETREVLQLVESFADAAAFEQSKAAFKELYRVVLRAQKLIQDCCIENWLLAAIRQRDKKEDFAEVIYEVQWCTSLLCSIICFRETAGGQTVPFELEGCEEKLAVIDYVTLELAARQDRETLRSDLQLLRQDHVCDPTSEGCVMSRGDPCVAGQLLQRLDSLAGANPTSVTSLHTVLWAVNPRDLPDVRSLGKGGFGEVRETSWLGEKYAKKIFSGVENESFRQESAVLAGLCHPHVVRLFCWSEDRKREKCSLVMDLMKEDLRRFLESDLTDAVLPTLAAVDLMLQIAQGLKYLQSRGIAHRDLKSLNILVKPLEIEPEFGYNEGYVIAKLADFGLSKTKNSSTRYSNQTPNVGTRKWMAPEVFINRSEERLPLRAHPLKADVYSFAIVCFEILTGEEPFQGVKLGELFERITVDRLRPKLPASCPNRLAFLIERCWDGEPQERPDFLEICKELRYIKGHLLLTGSVPSTRSSFGDTLQAGEHLTPGTYLESKNGKFQLLYKYDGSLAIYSNPDQKIVWTAWSNWGTHEKAGRVSMQKDGHLVAYHAGGKPYWATGMWSNEGIYQNSHLQLTNDGRIQTLDREGRLYWTNK